MLSRPVESVAMGEGDWVAGLSSSMRPAGSIGIDVPTATGKPTSPKRGCLESAHHRHSGVMPSIEPGIHMWTAPCLQEIERGMIEVIAAICPVCCRGRT